MEFFELFKITDVLTMEIAKIAYLFSLVISLLVYHKRNNIPGAIIVPGSLLLLFGNPLELLIVLFSIFFVSIFYFVIQKVFLKTKILTTKEKVLIMTALSLVSTITIYAIFDILFSSVVFGIIGVVASAMIAERIDRKYDVEVLKSFALAMILTLLSFLLFNFLAHNFLSESYIDFLNNAFDINGMNKISSIAMYILFLVAIVVNFVLSKYYDFKFAGFIVGIYLGILFFHPIYFFITTISILTGYFIVRYLAKYTFLYGFRSFVIAMLICASTFSFLQHLIAYFFDYQFSVFFGMNIAIFALCGVLTQSMFQDGVKQALKGALVMNIFVIPIIFVMLFLSRLYGWDLSFI
ncbi:MAG: hypothetical protein KAT32_03335 [Candidatus Moranbacteria bacterium]|nr:hypothetical protein [Candidatus Moranbacteria bacterium]